MKTRRPITVFQHTEVGAPGAAVPILESLGWQVSDAILATQSSESERLFVHLRGDLVVGAIGMNKPREMRRLRKLLTERPHLPRSELLQDFH